MLIIRLQRKKNGSVISRDIINILLINKGKATQSHSQNFILGTYNKRTNILLFNFDVFYFWLGRGVKFSTKAYSLLRSFFL